MAIGRGHMPPDEELRRRAAQVAEREARVAQRERDVAAREAELRDGDDVDRRLRRILLDDPASERRRTAARRAAPTLVAVCTWLLAWGGLGHATSAADWAIAATGAVVWAFALAAARR